MTKSVDDLNPKSQVVKGMEMTVLRCLQIIEAFDALEKGQDWADVPGPTYRKILGTDHYQQRAVIIEMFKRFQSGTLYREVLDLHSNLPPAAQARKEIKDGITRISARPSGRGEGSTPKSAARQRSRRA